MPGESRQVAVTVDGAASNHPLSYWVPVTNAPAPGWSQGDWSTAPGAYTVHVGTSSASTPLQQTVTLAAPGQPGAGGPMLTVTDVTASEGNGGTTAAVVTVNLSPASTLPVTVAYTIVDGTANGLADYAPASGTLTFAPGETTKTVTVLVAGDATDEDDEQFTVQLSAPTNATLADAQAIATIQDDDGLMRRYLAEGATSAFFDTRIALLNPSATAAAAVTLRFLRSDGVTVRTPVAAAARAPHGRPEDDCRARDGRVLDGRRLGPAARRRPHDALGRAGLRQPRRDEHRRPRADVVSRRRRDALGLRSVLPAAEPERRAGHRDRHAICCPPPPAPIVRTYTVGRRRALQHLGRHEEPGLANTDVSAVITRRHADHRRARDVSEHAGRPFGAGHESAGVTAPATTWFLAEGATGPFFDLFILDRQSECDRRRGHRDVPAARRHDGRRRRTRWRPRAGSTSGSIRKIRSWPTPAVSDASSPRPTACRSSSSARCGGRADSDDVGRGAQLARARRRPARAWGAGRRRGRRRRQHARPTCSSPTRRPRPAPRA